MPDGVFSLVQGSGHEIGLQLVQHPFTKAVAFTGSLRGGRALFDAASSRPHPVPVYAEMLSNPERSALISRLRTEALVRPVHVWDPDSYDVRRCGMNDLVEAIDYLPRPFAHAFVVAMAVADRLGTVLPE